MRFRSFVAMFLAAALSLTLTATAALAGSVVNPTVPEPSAILVWAGIAGAGGATYWLRNRRRS